MPSHKEKYSELCAREPGIPLFLRDWWLDATCRNQWDVALIEKSGDIVGVFPYYAKKIFWINTLVMPKLTPFLGIWLKYPEGQKYATKLSHEKSVTTELIDSLPHHDYFYQKLHYSITNWLPFYWKNFKQTTEYTYVIENLSDLDHVFSEFRDNIRREIRKAEKQVTVTCDTSLERIYEITQMTFKRQNMKLPFSFECIKKIDAACQKKECRKIFVAEDAEGKVHAAIYIVWDNHSAYYLFGGGDPEARTSGAMSLLMWEAIKFAATVSQKFDFEGSIIEPVERFFRSFGATQKPFFKITKSNSIIVKTALSFLGEIGLRRITRACQLLK